MNADLARSISIVVPLAPGESAWRALWADLSPVHGLAEVLFVGPEAPDALPTDARWVAAPLGRARQLNTGAAAARGTWLLFLHADSRLDGDWVSSVEDACAHAPGALSFFRLRFADDGPTLTWLNAALANVRASVLRMPFGDQGFLMARTTFEALGRFDPHVPYGEDHLLAWRATQRGAGPHAMRATLTTSARKYARRGWGKVTRDHVRATILQAAPEVARWAWLRIRPTRPAPATVACFVKTPGLSETKTRLAADVGRARADAIYDASVAACRALLMDCQAAGMQVAWAVAEDAALGHPRWEGMPQIAQGTGDLGARQSTVYDHLRALGRTPVLTGADVPQLWVGRIEEAVARLRWCDFVVCEATDGGYTLFAGRRAIPREVWTAVAYSQSDTLDRLEEALRPYGTLERLPPLSDLDHASDVALVEKDIRSAPPGAYSQAHRDALTRLVRAAQP